MMKMAAGFFLIFSGWAIVGCSGQGTTTTGACYLSDGREADCATGQAKTQTPATTPGVALCGTEFKSAFEAMLTDESSLDGWIAHCEAFDCPSTVRAQVRSSAENLLRSSATFERNFPNSVCKGRYRGGTKTVEGEFVTREEVARAQAKARAHMN